MSVEWENISSFEAWVESIKPNVIKAAGLALIQVLDDTILPAAQRYVAVDTGSLQASLHRGSGIDSDTAFIEIIAGGFGVINPKSNREVDYAWHQEYGTLRMRPHPYIRPSMIDGVSAIPSAYENTFKEVFA